MSAFSLCSLSSKKQKNKQNLNEKQFGINLVYDCNSVRGRISFPVTAANICASGPNLRGILLDEFGRFVFSGAAP